MPLTVAAKIFNLPYLLTSMDYEWESEFVLASLSGLRPLNKKKTEGKFEGGGGGVCFS